MSLLSVPPHTYMCTLTCVCGIGVHAIHICVSTHVCAHACVYVPIHRFVCLYMCVHMCMEAEKSHNLLSAAWRTRKARGVIQSKCEGPRTRSSVVGGQETGEVPAHAESRFALPPPYCSIQDLRGLYEAHLPGGGYIFCTQSTDSSARLFQKHPHRHPGNKLYQPSGPP